ncbi:MAG: terminase small subunit [Chloroflexi bacterium]|nr:terminase small subunit [Chloroflexota bacterium]
MTERQQRFVAEYCIDLNATQAAIRAGYSEKSADSWGAQLLSNSKVSQAIQRQLARLSRRLDLSAERVLQEYARIAFFDPRRVVSWGPDGVRLKPSDDLDADDAAAIAEVSETFVKTFTEQDGETTVRRDILKLTVKFHPKVSALADLAKHLQLFKDSESNVTNIIIHIATARERLESRIAGLAARLGAEGVLGEPER